jgi:hypothetical protein
MARAFSFNFQLWTFKFFGGFMISLAGKAALITGGVK